MKQVSFINVEVLDYGSRVVAVVAMPVKYAESLAGFYYIQGWYTHCPLAIVLQVPEAFIA